MQGTMQKQKCGYQWIRIGYADNRFSTVILTVSLSAFVILSFWAYREIPKTDWRLVHFLSIYIIAVFLYTNIGVWIHEQLHCLAFRGTSSENRTSINFSRKYVLFLNGNYQVRGPIHFQIIRRALLAPFILSIGLSALGLLGNQFLPGWWLPILLSMAVAGMIDMIHDFYMVSKIQVIGEKGKYWDRGKYLEVVWKD